jgi:hypothetical protein
VPWLATVLAHSAAAAPAVVAVDGDVAFGAGGVLGLEVGGEAPGSEHDQVNVAGQASLDGVLVLTPLGAFGTAPGAQATLVTWGARSGEFASVSGVQQAGGIDLAVSYGAGALGVAARLRGDVDGDGDVTPADQAVVGGNLGLFTTDYGAGDVNGDGVVDGADQDVVGQALPQAVPALGPLATTVLGLLLAGAGLHGLRARGRRRSTR